MNLIALREQRAAKVDALKAILAKAENEKRDLTDTEQAAFDAGKGELEKLEKDIGRAEFLAEAERRMAGEPIGTGDQRLDHELRSFSLRKAILSQVPGHAEDCGRERELSTEIARRAGRPFQGIAVPWNVFHQPIEKRVVTTTLPGGGPGSNIIAEDYMGAQFIDRLRSALVIRRAGARVLSGLVGNVVIPKLTGSATSGWVAENAALTPSDITLDQVLLSPKHVGALTEFSRNMLLQSSPDIEDLLRSDFAQVLAREIDRVAIKGGVGQEPSGVMANGGVATVDMSTPSWTNVLELIEAVEEADSEGTAFIGNSHVTRKLRSTAKVDSTDSVMIQQDPQSLAGYVYLSSSLVPLDGDSPSDKTSLLFGRWSDLVLGFWSELDLLINPYAETPYSKGNVQVRGMATADVALRHVESFAYSNTFAF
jgi:HK97 family phage major capsid protein